MPYLICAIDHEGKEKMREELRDAHRKHLKSVGDILLDSGALLDDDGVTIIGGLSILDTESKEEAHRFANEDPYSIAGIRKETSVIKWRRRWLDGKFLGATNS